MRQATCFGGAPIAQMLLDPEVMSADVTPLGVEAEALSKATMLNGIEWTKQLAKRRADVRAILYYSGQDGKLASTQIGFLKEP